MYNKLVITLFFLLSISTSSAMAAKNNTSTRGGRFQLIQLSDMRRDQYLLDTETGRIWSPTCAVPSQSGTTGDCSLTYWSEEWIAGKNTTEEKVNALAQKILKDREKAADQ